MAAEVDKKQVEDELADYESDEEEEMAPVVEADKPKAGSYVGIHSSGFRDFLLKPELLRAIVDCGFEHPSEVQHQCIPQAILGMDVLCQAKSGMGKTAVFVLSVLQQLEPQENTTSVIVLCHVRELAYQITREFERFCKYLPEIKTAAIFGGVSVQEHRELLKNDTPHIVVGTPGRVKQLIKEKVDKVKYFVVDECDQLLTPLDMRADVQDIFRACPIDKQVMMFSATLPKDTRVVCKRFMHEPLEIYVDEDKLTLHGLVQHFCKLKEAEKNRKLLDLLDALEFNQVVIFVKSVNHAIALNRILIEHQFPSIAIHSGMQQEERIRLYKEFKEFKHRILVATNLFGRGIDIERVNIVINYNMTDEADIYLHRVGRAGRFGTKGLAISFISSDEDEKVLKDVQDRFVVKITPLPDKVETATYM